MLNGSMAPDTMPGLRCGATLVSLPTSVFFTSTRSLARLPPAKSPYRAFLMSCSPQELILVGSDGAEPFCSICSSRSASSRCWIPMASRAVLVSALILPTVAASPSALVDMSFSLPSMASIDFMSSSMEPAQSMERAASLSACGASRAWTSRPAACAPIETRETAAMATRKKREVFMMRVFQGVVERLRDCAFTREDRLGGWPAAGGHAWRSPRLAGQAPPAPSGF
jgi:hypothetical protein